MRFSVQLPDHGSFQTATFWHKPDHGFTGILSTHNLRRYGPYHRATWTATYSLEHCTDTTTTRNLASELKPAGDSAAKVKVRGLPAALQTRPRCRHETDYSCVSSSLVVCARTKRPPGMSACSSRIATIRSRSARHSLASTRAACRALVSISRCRPRSSMGIALGMYRGRTHGCIGGVRGYTASLWSV